MTQGGGSGRPGARVAVTEFTMLSTTRPNKAMRTSHRSAPGDRELSTIHVVQATTTNAIIPRIQVQRRR